MGAFGTYAAWSLALALLSRAAAPAFAQEVPLNGLGRFDGWRENALIGYGLVTGLAGSGDTRRSDVTRQALRNVLSRLGTSVTEDQISSRNVAVVMVTAMLPASANVGDRIDATVSSIGDARSLAGGHAADDAAARPRPAPLCAGAGPAGGRRLQLRERPQPAAAQLSDHRRACRAARPIETGGRTRRSLTATANSRFLLSEPSFWTAQRIAERINGRIGAGSATARTPTRCASASPAIRPKFDRLRRAAREHPGRARRRAARRHQRAHRHRRRRAAR